MSDPTSKDTLFANPRPHLVDFAFDEQVARVFPDMIRRSVPGYDAVIAMLGVFANHYVRPHTRAYDLGCSQGAATLALRRHIQVPDVTLVAVDNAPAMIERCRQNIAADLSPSQVELRCEDIQQTPIANASLVALNFTLQFLPPDQRDTMVRKIADGLLSGGVLVLSEKICFAEDAQQALFTGLHHDFKRLNGYSDLEISQKRQAIENVLIPETAEQHSQRLLQNGFSQVQCWFQCFNFASFVAVK
ncbi:MAG TPA: carboxy-S-adenosyl-L-methionine synthase CmoA [Dongiaceae bacterium]|nr:carboxy-S-adenosyl-L-methionine synthase CmoA [Dongiaceae bacterium]